MKELVKVGFNKGLVVGVAIVTASAVLTVASIPKHVIMWKRIKDLKNKERKKKPNKGF